MKCNQLLRCGQLISIFFLLRYIVKASVPHAHFSLSSSSSDSLDSKVFCFTVGIEVVIEITANTSASRILKENISERIGRGNTQVLGKSNKEHMFVDLISNRGAHLMANHLPIDLNWRSI